MLGNLSCAMSTFNAGPLIKTLSQKSALLEHTGEHPPPENWMVRDPLHGLVPAHATRVTRSLIKLDAPPKRNDDFPQIDVSSGFSWSVWPNWRLNPLLGTGQDTQDSEPLRWHSTGLCSSKPPGIGNIIIEWSPEIYRAEALARSALGALASSFGPLPWRCVRLLLEEQARDLGMAKGIAVPYSGELWCRVQLRPNSKQDAEPTEIIIHELLHYLVEFNTPAGHALTEGLITYLARLLTVQAGAAPQDWMRHISVMRPPISRRCSFGQCFASRRRESSHSLPAATSIRDLPERASRKRNKCNGRFPVSSSVRSRLPIASRPNCGLSRVA